MHRLAVVSLALVGCAKPPPPKPPAAELPVHDLATVAGTWVTSDDLDIAYKLALGADGTYDLRVDRNRMGTCEIKGKLTGSAKAYTLAFGEHQCRREWSNTATQLAIDSYTGQTLTVTVTTPEGSDRRTYQRAPDQ